jgi:hypothetical protein
MRVGAGVVLGTGLRGRGGPVGGENIWLVSDDLFDVGGDAAKETMEGDGDLLLVAEGFVSRLGGGLVEGALPLLHVILPVGGGEKPVARPFGLAARVRSSRGLD